MTQCTEGVTTRRPFLINDHRMLWREKDFTCYMRNVQEASIAPGKGEFTDKMYHALLFVTKATVETIRFLLGRGIKQVQTRNSGPVEALFGWLRSMCGGNDACDARAVTTALDSIVKDIILPEQMQVTETDAEELTTAVPQELTAQLENLKGHLLNRSRSVIHSGLVYIGGYLVRLISEFGCNACVTMVTTNKGDPLFTLLHGQDKSGLHHPNHMFLALLDNILVCFEKAAKHFLQTKVHKVHNLLRTGGG